MTRTLSVGLALLAWMALASPSFADTILTVPSDPILGFYNTSIGGDITVSGVGNGEGLSPPGEEVWLAIDGDTNTKYLNFGSGGGGGTFSPTKGVGTGFYVTVLGQSVLTGVQVITANDALDRDPLSISVEGANGGNLDLGSSWTHIGTVNLGIDTDPGRFASGPIVPLTDSNSYTSYRVIVQSQRGNENSTQYAELNLIGNFLPEPGTGSLVGLGIAFIAWRRRRSAA